MRQHRQPGFFVKASAYLKSYFTEITWANSLLSIFGSAMLAFGLYNIHSVSGVTEGGILGLTLLLDHWLHISPAYSGLFFNIICYAVGWKTFGKNFVVYSAISTIGFSAFYKVFELFDPLFPEIAAHPLLASVVGALFVGISCGICVRCGGAPSGDDAIAMSLSKILHVRIQHVYFFSDLIVLLASLSYIPLQKIMYSFLTVILSGQIIGIVVKIKLPKKKPKRLPSEETEEIS